MSRVALVMMLAAGVQQEPTAAELWEEAIGTRPPDRRQLEEIVRRWPGSPEAQSAAGLLRERRGPSVGAVLLHFLFGTIFGWWILFVTGFLLSLPLVNRIRAWAAERRFLRAQAQKLANPQNADARFQLAEMCLEAGRWRRACRYAEEAVAIAGTSPLYDMVPYAYLRALGQAHYGCRRWPQAAQSFEWALKVKSDLGHFDALLGLAKACYRMGEVEKALEFARHAAAEQQSHLESYFRWAQAAAGLGRAEEVAAAVGHFRRVLGTLPRYARQRRTWWRIAFLTFPLSRLIG